ncbi:MAG TPA: hypothetical protein VFX76_01635 [Roseiflexaceae bacterium]|nr:hypothetical protein [Roseiflexaceae bacterium]
MAQGLAASAATGSAATDSTVGGAATPLGPGNLPVQPHSKTQAMIGAVRRKNRVTLLFTRIHHLQ